MFMFYVNNYISWDQLNKLYDLDWLKKNIRNVDEVASKLKSVLIKVINQRLEAVKKKKRKKEKKMERQKTKTMATKCQRARREISLLSEEKENYKSYIWDE